MFERHDLVFFKRSSLDEIIKTACCVLPYAPQKYWNELFEAVGTHIPGIVRRQENTPPGFVDVGFSSPRRVNGVHYRVSASIPIKDIEDILTPFRIMQMAEESAKAPNGQALARLSSIAGCFGMTMGLLGSHALQLVTGLPYVSASSDIDLIAKWPMENLGNFAADITECEKANHVAADIEIRVSIASGEDKNTTWDVKLKELVSQQTSVMGKSISGVKLLRWGHDSNHALGLYEY